jgi:hypothetical protein
VMNSNLEYELCSEAIKKFNSGEFGTLDAACLELNANLTLANIMLGNEHQLKEEIVSEPTRISRISICESCDNNINSYCDQCACPVTFITNLKFKTCPLEKW